MMKFGIYVLSIGFKPQEWTNEVWLISKVILPSYYPCKMKGQRVMNIAHVGWSILVAVYPTTVLGIHNHDVTHQTTRYSTYNRVVRWSFNMIRHKKGFLDCTSLPKAPDRSNHWNIFEHWRDNIRGLNNQGPAKNSAFELKKHAEPIQSNS